MKLSPTIKDRLFEFFGKYSGKYSGEDTNIRNDQLVSDLKKVFPESTLTTTFFDRPASATKSTNKIWRKVGNEVWFMSTHSNDIDDVNELIITLLMYRLFPDYFLNVYFTSRGNRVVMRSPSLTPLQDWILDKLIFFSDEQIKEKLTTVYDRIRDMIAIVFNETNRNAVSFIHGDLMFTNLVIDEVSLKPYFIDMGFSSLWLDGKNLYTSDSIRYLHTFNKNKDLCMLLYSLCEFHAHAQQIGLSRRENAFAKLISEFTIEYAMPYFNYHRVRQEKLLKNISFIHEYTFPVM